MSTTLNKNHTYGIQNIFCKYDFIRVEQLGGIYDVLTSNGLWNKVKNWFTHSDEAVTSMRVYPISLAIMQQFPLLQGIKLAGQVFNDVYIYPINPIITKQIGVTYTLPNAETFVDLQPHTQIQLYLPFIDFIDLPVNEIIGNQMRIYYVFDFSSGTATAYVEITKNGVPYVLATKTAKIGVDVPYGKTNSAENLKNIVNTAISTAISLYTIGGSNMSETLKTVGKVATISKATLSVANSLDVRYQRGGLAGSVGGLTAPTHPYLIIKKQKLVPVDEEMYAHTYGKPLYESRVLSQIHGFTILDEIHLTGFGTATDSEITEIERLLKTGVIL